MPEHSKIVERVQRHRIWQSAVQLARLVKPRRRPGVVQQLASQRLGIEMFLDARLATHDAAIARELAEHRAAIVRELTEHRVAIERMCAQQVWARLGNVSGIADALALLIAGLAERGTVPRNFLIVELEARVQAWTEPRPHRPHGVNPERALPLEQLLSRLRQEDLRHFDPENPTRPH